MVHSRRACRDYLRDLSSFVRARLGDQLQLPLPQLEAGPEDSSRQQLEASLAARGWAAVDWSTRRLSRQQLSAAMEAAATLRTTLPAPYFTLDQEPGAEDTLQQDYCSY